MHLFPVEIKKYYQIFLVMIDDLLIGIVDVIDVFKYKKIVRFKGWSEVEV